MKPERLAQYNTFQENHLGFKGIIAGVADELIPDGYVPDMQNLKIRVDGIAETVVNPQSIAPPTGQGGAGKELKSIFVWQQDSGTNVLLVQYGPNLYRRDTDHWDEVLNGAAHAFGTSTEKASYAGGMLGELYIVNKDTQCMKLTSAFTLTTLPNGPKGKYVTLWKNRLFIGCVTTFYGLSATTSASGSAETLPFGAASSAVIWSNIGLVDDMHDGATHDNGWYTGSIIALRTPENAACTGLLPVQENLLMFTESAIFSFSGYAESNFSSFDYYHGANTPKDNAVATAGGVYYVSADGFYALSTEPKKVSESVSQLIDPTDALVSCTYFDSRIWFCTGHTLVAFNVGTGAWEKYQYGTSGFETQDIIFAGDHLYLGMGITGNVLQLDVESTTTPGYKSWYLATPVHNQGITSGDKRFKTLFIYARNTDEVMHISREFDYGAGEPVYPDLLGGLRTVERWGTLLWGAEATSGHGHWIFLSADIVVYKRAIIANVARTIKLRFNGNGDAALLGYAIVYSPKRKFGVR